MKKIMEQILVTKKKILSFEDICPQWSEYLANTKRFDFSNSVSFNGSDQQIYNLAQPKNCIVGEAHGEDNYSYKSEDGYCDRCREFSYDVFEIRGSRSFERFKGKFVAHFNRKHVETFIGTKTSD